MVVNGAHRSPLLRRHEVRPAQKHLDPPVRRARVPGLCAGGRHRTQVPEEAGPQSSESRRGWVVVPPDRFRRRIVVIFASTSRPHRLCAFRDSVQQEASRWRGRGGDGDDRGREAYVRAQVEGQDDVFDARRAGGQTASAGGTGPDRVRKVPAGPSGVPGGQPDRPAGPDRQGQDGQGRLR